MTLTPTLALMLLGPELLALLVALVVTLIRRARTTRAPVAVGVRAWVVAGVLMAMGLVLFGSLVSAALIDAPFSRSLMEHRYVVPLSAGLVGVLVCLAPAVRRPLTGTADLSPRTLTSFAERWWFVALATVMVVVLLVAFLAGMASTPDEDGRYTMHHVDFGAGSVGTGIYGWYYSVPALGVMAVLVLATLLVVRALARPPLSDQERAADIATRRWRTRNVLVVASGALLVHLALVLGSLAGTASLRGRFSTGEGSFGAGSTFAALEAPLRVASTAAEVGGWFLWFLVLCAAAVPALRTRSRSPWLSASR